MTVKFACRFCCVVVLCLSHIECVRLINRVLIERFSLPVFIQRTQLLFKTVVVYSFVTFSKSLKHY